MSFHEIREYKDLVIDKSGMNEKEYISLLNHLLKHVALVPEEQVKGKIGEAKELLGKIDPDDVIFLATTLSMDDSKIWSDDTHFEKHLLTLDHF